MTEWRSMLVESLRAWADHVIVLEVTRRSSGAVVGLEVVLRAGAGPDSARALDLDELDAGLSTELLQREIESVLLTGEPLHRQRTGPPISGAPVAYDVRRLDADHVAVCWNDAAEADRAGAALGLDPSELAAAVGDRPLWIVCDPEGRQWWRSGPLAELVNRESGPMDGPRMDVTLIHERDRSKGDDLFAGFASGASFGPIRIRTRLGAGGYRRLEWRGTPLKTFDDRTLVVLAGRAVADWLGQVVTLEALLEGIDVAAFVRDRNEVLYVNRAYREYTDREEGEIPGLYEDWHEADLAPARAAIDPDRAIGRSSSVEIRMRHRSGVYRWVLATITPLEMSGPDEQLSLVTIADVHERRLAQDRFQELTELAPDAVFRFAVGGPHGTRIEYMSPAYADIFGIPVEATADREQLWSTVDPAHHDDLRRLVHGEISQLTVRGLRPDGRTLWVELRAHHQYDESGRAVSMLGICRDVTELKQAELDLAHRATHDPLTGLANRTLLHDHMEYALARYRRKPDSVVALAFIDLDRFKVVNDLHGHDVGDQMLVEVAARLRAASRGSDTVARLGGDEFAVMLDAPGSVDAAVAAAERLRQTLDGHVDVAGRSLRCQASVGLAFAGPRAQTVIELLRNADTALVRAKERGRGRTELFDDSLRLQLEARMSLEVRVREAVESGAIELHFQPEVDLETGRVVGSEALARWTGPDGTVSPADFVPIAEDNGLIVPLGETILRQSLTVLRGWGDAGHDVEMKVNVSARQLAERDVVDTVHSALHDHGIDPTRLCLEVTERVLLENAAVDRLARLRELGVRVAIDDFGTGFSSLSYLHRLPVDVLKIDRSFVGYLTSGGREAAIPASIVELAATMGLEVTAEGIETVEQRDHLLGLGCRRGQGFLYSPAVPPDVFAAALSRGALG